MDFQEYPKSLYQGTQAQYTEQVVKDHDEEEIASSLGWKPFGELPLTEE